MTAQTVAAQTIWMVAETDGGTLSRGSLEALTFCQRLKEELGAVLECVVLGDGQEPAAAATLASYQVDRVLVCLGDRLARYTPAPHVDALVQAWQGGPASAPRRPAYLVLPHSYRSVDFMARVAHRLNGALLPEVLSFRKEGEELRWRRPVLRGKMQAEVRVRPGSPVVVLSVQGGSFAAADASSRPEGDSAPVETIEISELAAPDREIDGIERASAEGVDLTAAEVVVAVGRGVGDPEKLGPIRDLARALGGELGASRPVVDSGWLPRELQIGSSGQTVAPKLYVAIGISGAIQHLMGMRASQCVVAINKDSSAPIFRVANYGIVGDLHKVVPALNEALAAHLALASGK